jgi:enhancing lycopene biosynthesis protein 2
MAKRVAVLLSGCGVFDGTEIQEAVLTLVALDNAGAEYTCCAPNMDQAEVINHITGEKMAEKRNVLVESARIARGKIKDLVVIKADDFDAILMPGGYGAAKNLSSYATEGVNAAVQPEVARVIQEFVSAKKPVGAICISPVVVANTFRNSKDVRASMTIGTDEATRKHIEEFGSEHVSCPVKEFVVDRKNRIVSTPAYMLAKGPAEVAVGIEKLVKAVLELCEER